MEDLIEAHTLALRHLEAGGQSDVFNLGSEQGFSVRQMIETARRVTGRPLPVVVGARRPGDPARLVASSRKAGDVLGWQPRQGVDEIIASAWRWHSRHPAGYKK